jgi:protein-tyrosine phosphatase
MIDVHCHALPGVDDGAQNLAEGLEMLRMAAVDGITAAVITPHLNPSVRWEARLESIKNAFADFQGKAAEAIPAIRLHLAAEVMMGPEIINMIGGGFMPWIGRWEGARVFLMEFPPDIIPTGSVNLAQKAGELGAAPLIAHPERNLEIQGDIEKLAPLMEAGCLLQVTSGSLTGQFGKEAYMAAAAIIKKGWAHFLATDSHDARYRRPDLSAGVAMAGRIAGADFARDMVTTFPGRLIKDNGFGQAGAYGAKSVDIAV